jgi:hypothetical protein
MNPGKNRCEYLKEVRRRIAVENGIPLKQRKCTFEGECSGTCHFCEAEMLYLEKELHQRKTLGKTVTVAGIALSSIVMASCASTAPLAGCISYGNSTPSTTEQKTDSSALRSVNEEYFTQIRGNVSDGQSVVVDGTRIRPSLTSMSFMYDVVAKFPKEYGSPVQWLGHRLRPYSTYMADEQLNETMVTFVVNADGTVSDVDFAKMPVTGSEKDFNFQNEVRKQVLSMPRWEPATKDNVPVPFPVAITVSDLRQF